MERQQAIEIYLAKTINGRNTINKIMEWDETKSMKDNAKFLNFKTSGSCTQFALRFGLRAKTIRGKTRCMKSIKTQAYVELRKIGWKYDEIAAAFDRTKQNIEQSIGRRDLILDKDPCKDRRPK